MKYEIFVVRTVNRTLEAADEYEDKYIRRVQLTGRGSYIVSIPKSWVQEAGVKKGARVEFSRQENRALLLTPFEAKYDDEGFRSTVSIKADADPEGVARRIISLYVVGFSTIEINSKTGSLPARVRDVIREVARTKLVGTELVTESSRSSTLQVLLTYPQLLVPDALRRMSSITSSMQQDSVRALLNSDPELARQVLKIDDEIDRFSLYIIRQLKWAVQHPPLIGKIGLHQPVECLGYRIITKNVERSADHAARVAQNSLLIQHELDSALIKDTRALSDMSLHMMETALRALFSDSYELAESVLGSKEEASGLEGKLVEHLLREKMPASELSAYRLISESLRRIGEYATDIAEEVLNLSVHKSIEHLVKRPATNR